MLAAVTASGHGHGRGRVVARRRGDDIVLAELHAASPLRFLLPQLPGARAANVCVVTFGGGLLDGDVLDLALVVEPGATLVVFTQSTTKVFRGASRQHIRAEVHGTLVLLPDPVACFAGADYTQRVNIALHGEGSAIVLDGFTSGRPAYGERWAARAIDLATHITRDGALVVRDALRLDARDAAIAPRLDPFDALVTLIAIGPRIAPVRAGVLAPERSPDVVAAPSPIGGDAAIVRIAASPRAALAEARARLRRLDALGVVDPFASRP